MTETHILNRSGSFHSVSYYPGLFCDETRRQERQSRGLGVATPQILGRVGRGITEGRIILSCRAYRKYVRKWWLL